MGGSTNSMKNKNCWRTGSSSWRRGSSKSKSSTAKSRTNCPNSKPSSTSAPIPTPLGNHLTNSNSTLNSKRNKQQTNKLWTKILLITHSRPRSNRFSSSKLTKTPSSTFANSSSSSPRKANSLPPSFKNFNQLLL